MICSLIFSLYFFATTAASDSASNEWGEKFFNSYKETALNSKKLLQFWRREAKFLDLREMEWTLDPETKCNHFITLLPATIETQAPPLILIHRPESEKISWGTLAGFIDWMSLRQLSDRKRSRDIFFIKSCGDEVTSKYGTRDLVHYLIRSLPGVDYSWTAFQKLEAAGIWEKFPELRKAEMVISHSVPAFHFNGHAELFLPIVTATKGYWLGTNSKDSIPNDLVHNLNEKQKFFGDFWKSLHPEMTDFASVAGVTLPWWEQTLTWLRARLFFSFYSWQQLIESIWSVGKLPNQITYDFLGDREQREIEKEVATEIPKDQTISTADYIPFRRSFIFSADSQMIFTALKNRGGIRPFTFIAPQVSDATFFRWAGISAYDVFPLRGSNPLEVNWSEIQRAIDIKSAVLQKLIQ